MFPLEITPIPTEVTFGFGFFIGFVFGCIVCIWLAVEGYRWQRAADRERRAAQRARSKAEDVVR